MSSQKPADHAANDKKNEFMCETGDCADHASSKGQVFKVGRKYATALAGFVAGVIVASIVFFPWLQLMGKLCPVEGK